MKTVRVLLISTYDLGRQPFGLASPAAWLRQQGVEVDCIDTSRDRLSDESVLRATLVAFYLPMHTATRLAGPLIDRVRAANPQATLAAYGLYTPLNAAWLRARGVSHVLGPDAEEELVELVQADLKVGLYVDRVKSQETNPTSHVRRLHFIQPDRSTLPPLIRYAALQMPDGTRRVVGNTDATRGCKHLCLHCPVVPVYRGVFRAIPLDVVLADIRAQVVLGAEHISFGDPDFFNGPTHARRLVERLAAEFPNLTYDVTIKIEHLLKHADLLPLLGATGCLFVTSAVESVDDAVLARLRKGHTRADFVRAVSLCRAAGIALSPTFITFTPWTTLEGYVDLLDELERLDMTEAVPPIQLGIRLLVTAESPLLDLPDVRDAIDPFDGESLTWPWRHRDPRVDTLQQNVMRLVASMRQAPRSDVFRAIRALAHEETGLGFLRNEIGKPDPVSFSFRASPHGSVVLLRGTGPRGNMKRVLLVATTTGYQIRSFGEAAERLGIRLVFASDRCDQLEDPWWDQAIPVRFHDADASVEAVRGACRDAVPGAVIAVGDRPTILAAHLNVAFGLPGNPPSAAKASRNKLSARAAFRAAGLATPEFRDVSIREDPAPLAATTNYPAVIKPLALSGSRGVMRVDDERQFVASFERLRALLQSPDVCLERDAVHDRALIERFIPGREYAIEGVLTRGRFQPFALFDKPDPLDGPFFEETIYVTPSRQPQLVQQRIIDAVAAAARALDLWHGPVHAECRVNDQGVYVLEVAARPIGGLCSKALRFTPPAGEQAVSLEHVLLRHALGDDVSEYRREAGASGVMMIPIPQRGVYRGVDGVADARAVAGIEDVRMTAKADSVIVPLPEGRSYLGFLFARGADPGQVECALRQAHSCLRFAIEREVQVVG